MKINDLLPGNDITVAYAPRLRNIAGSINAALFLCQLIYWTGKETNKDGWIYKTAEEIEYETGLTYDEQKTARKKLIKARLIEEKYKRLDHSMYFRIDKEWIAHVWELAYSPKAQVSNAYSPKPETSIPETMKPVFPAPALAYSPKPETHVPETGIVAMGSKETPLSYKGITEITPEITAKNTAKMPQPETSFRLREILKLFGDGNIRVSPKQKEDVLTWKNDFDNNAIQEAIDIAAELGKAAFEDVREILFNLSAEKPTPTTKG